MKPKYNYRDIRRQIKIRSTHEAVLNQCLFPRDFLTPEGQGKSMSAGIPKQAAIHIVSPRLSRRVIFAVMNPGESLVTRFLESGRIAAENRFLKSETRH
jgi:hypothetical protein